MTDLLLIRHATNDWVGSDRLAGWTPGVHLNAQGHEEAEALATRLAAWPIEAIYSSPLERAMETAAAVAAHHQLPVHVLENVGESRYGDWTGQSIKDLVKTPEWARVQVNPSAARFPNGESLGEMQARVVAALNYVQTLHPRGVVAVFSHADIVKAAVAYYAGIHLDLFQRLVVDTASVSWIRFTSHGPRLLRLNDTGRLDPPKPHEEKPADAPAATETADAPAAVA